MVATQDPCEQAACHVLNLLNSDMAKTYQIHLDGCTHCQAEVDALRRVVPELGFLAAPVTPPAGLKFRLLAHLSGSVDKPSSAGIKHQTWKHWTDTPVTNGVTLTKDGESQWESTEWPGISVRKLFVNTAENRCSMLIRMEAGTSYPPHEHGGAEECFVLEGDLYGEDFSMVKGDFQRSEMFSVHGVQATRGGCLLLLNSSLDDRLIEVPT